MTPPVGQRPVVVALVALAALAGALGFALRRSPLAVRAEHDARARLRTVRVVAEGAPIGHLTATVFGAERRATPIVRGADVLVDDGLAEGWLVVDDGVHAPSSLALGGLARNATLALESAEPLAMTVVDEEKRPIAAAEIRAAAEPWASALPVLRTGADGRAAMPRLPHVPLKLRLAAPGHLTRLLDTTAFGGEAIVLERLVERTFELRDEAGEPVSDARVWVSEAGETVELPHAIEAPGVLRLALPRKTPTPVHVLTATTCSPPGLVLHGDMAAQPRLVLRDGWTRRVLVRTRDGAPAQALVHYGDPDDLLWRPTAMTDAMGAVTLGPFCSNAVTITAEVGDASASTVARRAQEGDATLTVEPPARLRLRVRDDEGKPAGGVIAAITVLDEHGATRAETGEEPATTVAGGFVPLGELGVTQGPVATLAQLERDGFAQGGVGHPVTNADGELRLTRLPAGRVTVAVRRAGYVPATIGPVDLVAGRELELQARIARAAHLDGNVLDDRGFPQRGLVVRLTDDEGRTTEVVTDRDGRFSFEEARGPVVLGVRKAGGGEDLEQVALTLEPGTHTEHDVTVRDASAREYRIRALDSRGYPIEGASVALRPPGGLVRLSDTRTARDGIATLAFPVGATLEVSVRAQGFAPAAVLLDGDTPEAVVTLDTIEDRTIRVVDDRRNAPVAGALVWIRTVFGDAAQVVARTTDRAGIVHLQASLGSSVEYVVVAADHGVVRGSVLHGERDGAVRAPNAVVFEGRVASGDAPVEGAIVALETLGRAGAGLGASKSDAQGAFRFALASTSTRSLEVCAPGYRCKRVGPLRGDDRRPTDVGVVNLERATAGGGDVAIDARAGAFGLRVESVYPGSKAAESTLRIGDVITSLDGRPAEPGALVGAPGSAVIATVERDGRKLRIALPRERVLRP
jgi:hypothetical protein